ELPPLLMTHNGRLGATCPAAGTGPPTTCGPPNPPPPALGGGIVPAMGGVDGAGGAASAAAAPRPPPPNGARAESAAERIGGTEPSIATTDSRSSPDFFSQPAVEVISPAPDFNKSSDACFGYFARSSAVFVCVRHASQFHWKIRLLVHFLVDRPN